jgi:hypothetical protein
MWRTNFSRLVGVVLIIAGPGLRLAAIDARMTNRVALDRLDIVVIIIIVAQV